MDLANGKNSIFFFLLISLSSFFIFFPALSVFFSADDFYNMRLVMGHTLTDVASAFLFVRYENFLFYRPLTTQAFFFFTKPIFGFNPLFYHLISFSVFLSIVFIVYKLTYQLTFRRDLSFLTTFFYALSPSNFTRLSWIVQIQELLLGLLVLVSSIFFVTYLRTAKVVNYLLSLFCFILALTSKESAVMIPGLLFLVVIFVRGPLAVLPGDALIKGLVRLIPFIMLWGIYLYLRLVKIGVSLGEHYFTSFSLRSIINTAIWYVLWGIGLPEELANFDIFQTKAGLDPQFVKLISGELLLNWVSFLIFIALFSILLAKSLNYKSLNYRIILFSIGWLFVSLLPHLFSPWHKFAYALTIPLFGISLFLASFGNALRKDNLNNRVLFSGLLISYVFLSLTTVQFTKNNHWIFKRGEVASRVFLFLNKYHPKISESTSIVFVNDREPDPVFGLSRQISLTLSKDAALQLLYNNPHLRVYYEDDDKNIILQLDKRDALNLPSSLFYD